MFLAFNKLTIALFLGLFSVGLHAQFTFGPADTVTGCTGGTCPANLVIPRINAGTLVTTIDTTAFENKSLTSVIIPDSITTIGQRAFIDNQLTSVIIPNSVITLQGGAFNGNQLNSVTISNSLTEITRSVFGRNQLTSITIPSGITFIDRNAFTSNPALISILFEGDFPGIDSPFDIATLQNIFYRAGRSGFDIPLLGGITPTLLAFPASVAVPTSTPFTLVVLMYLLGLISWRYHKLNRHRS